MMAEPIRVAQVMGYMNGGGVEAVVMNYYRHIDREKVQFDFIVCEGSTLVPREEIESLGGRIFMIPGYREMPRYLSTLVSLFKHERWNIVHSHVNSLSVFPLYAAKKAGVPVRIAHSHTTSGKDGLVRNLMKNGLCHFSKMYPTHYAACSACAGAWLFGEAESVTIFPNGVDFERFGSARSRRIETRVGLGIEDDAFVLGHVGRFVPVKNHMFLLEIFKELHQIIPHARLLLVGDGPLMSDVELAAETMGLIGDTIILGQRSDIPDLLSSMDAFCLPSLYEGMPVVGVECQASGVPILVSTNVSEELRMSSLVEYESLDSSPKVWAARILDILNRPVEYFPSWMGFDIKNCSSSLCEYYLRLSGKN